VGAGVAPTHSYSHAGAYTVKLAVIDALGFAGTETSLVTVGPAGQIKKLAVRAKGGSELLIVTVSGPGTVRVGKTSKRLPAAGSASFKVGSAPKKRHKLKVKATVVYTPGFGPAVRRTYSEVVFGR
jgi:PKD repeat protein